MCICLYVCMCSCVEEHSYGGQEKLQAFVLPSTIWVMGIKLRPPDPGPGVSFPLNHLIIRLSSLKRSITWASYKNNYISIDALYRQHWWWWTQLTHFWIYSFDIYSLDNIEIHFFYSDILQSFSHEKKEHTLLCVYKITMLFSLSIFICCIIFMI